MTFPLEPPTTAPISEVSDEVYTEASRFFTSQALTELLYVVGTYMLLARIARTGRVPLDATPAAAISLK
jgi:alkylhydroperoxidase family enzyme